MTLYPPSKPELQDVEAASSRNLFAVTDAMIWCHIRVCG